jgi:hypothetical protein
VRRGRLFLPMSVHLLGGRDMLRGQVLD